MSAPSAEEAHRAELRQAIASFDSWLLALRRGEQPAAATSLPLAQARRRALKELIALDPQAALAAAVPRGLRGDLPPEILAELETPIDAFGALRVALTCFGADDKIERTADIGGRQYVAHVFGRRSATLSKHRLPIHGIAIDNQLAIDEQPYRLLDAVEYGGDPSQVRAAVVAVGDSIQRFADAATLAQWSAGTLAAEAAPNPNVPGPDVAAAPANWTFGEKTVLLLPIEFPDDPGAPFTTAEIAASAAQVGEFYRDVSRDRCSLRGVVLPVPLRVSKTKASVASADVSYFDLVIEARTLARAYDAANGNTGAYNPDRADRYVIIAKSISALGFLGSASVGGSDSYLNGTIASDVMAHELGHNHGLHHAHSWRPSGASAIGDGTHIAYGDVFDDMGNTATVPGGHFNTRQKEILLYLEPSEVTNVTTSGTYRIFRHDHRGASGVQALKINVGDYDYWLEHRQQIPRTSFNQTTRLRTGLQLRWGRYPSSYAGNGTYLLDLTPTSGSGMDDAPMIVGESFADPNSGLTITPLATGGTAPREWIDVRITFGASDGNNRNPILAASLPHSILPARTDVTFTASASDPDGDTALIRWDFGDAKGLRAGSPLTYRYARGGNFAVLCSAIDGRGGLSSKSFFVTVDDPLLAWTRTDAFSGVVFNAVVHDGRQFLAGSTSNLATSPDGFTWTRRPAIAGNSASDFAVSGSAYVAVGFRPTASTIGVIAYSNDAATWRDVTPSPLPTQLRGVAFGAGRFVAVGTAGTLLHSLDGVAWISTPPLTTKDLWSVRFAAGRFVIAGDSGTILVSSDGLAWENRTQATAATFTVLGYHRDKWVTGNGTNIWTSSDTQTWAQQPPSSRPSFQRLVSLGADGLLAPAANDTLFFSDAGLSWESTTLVTPTTTAFLRSAAVANGTVVLVTSDGRFYQTRAHSPVADPPQVAKTPANQFLPVGQDVTLDAGGRVPGTSYQWLKNGDQIEGATNPTLLLKNSRSEDSGAYTLNLVNYAGNTTTAPATLVIDPNTARVVNLSIRTRAGTGANIFTLGFVVGRTFYTASLPATTKPLLMRGIGPTLGAFGITGALADPRIDVFDGATRIAGNDDWSVGTSTPAQLTDAFSALGAFPLAASSKDAAMLSPFAPKSYTVQLTGANSATGLALAELYDLDSSVLAMRLSNVSARAQVGTDADVLIAGIVVQGGGERTVLVRAIGPGLNAFGVGGALAEPVLTLFNGNQRLASNTRWSTAPNATAIRSAAQRVGAFPLAETSADCALLTALPAGSYTIQIAGVANTSGVALVEIYEVP